MGYVHTKQGIQTSVQGHVYPMSCVKVPLIEVSYKIPSNLGNKHLTNHSNCSKAQGAK